MSEALTRDDWVARVLGVRLPASSERVAAADAAGHVVLWGRVPVEGMTGELLASLLDRLGTEAGRARGELAGEDED